MEGEGGEAAGATECEGGRDVDGDGTAGVGGAADMAFGVGAGLAVARALCAGGVDAGVECAAAPLRAWATAWRIGEVVGVRGAGDVGGADLGGGVRVCGCVPVVVVFCVGVGVVDCGGGGGGGG